MRIFHLPALALVLLLCGNALAVEPAEPRLMLEKANSMADAARVAYTRAQMASVAGQVDDVKSYAAAAEDAARSARNFANAAAAWLSKNKGAASEADTYATEGGLNAAIFAQEIAQKASGLVGLTREAVKREAEAAAQREAEAAAQREAEAAAKREAEAAAKREAEAAAKREAEAAAQREAEAAAQREAEAAAQREAEAAAQREAEIQPAAPVEATPNTPVAPAAEAPAHTEVAIPPTVVLVQ
jgi:hypothetical protein